VFFLGEDFDRVITLRKEGLLLRAHCFDKAVGGDPVKFYGLNQVGGDSVTRYIHMKGAWLSAALLLIQSPIWKQLEKASGFQGWLEMIVFLLVQLMTWEFISNAGRLFHSLSSRSHRSFILVEPTLAMAFPSLSPLTLGGG